MAQLCVEQLRHLSLVPHIYARVNRGSIGSDTGLSPIRRQAIIWINAGLLSIGPFGTNFKENLIKIQNFSFTKMHLNISSAKRRPFCPGEDELSHYWCGWHFVGYSAPRYGRNQRWHFINPNFPRKWYWIKNRQNDVVSYKKFLVLMITM